MTTSINRMKRPLTYSIMIVIALLSLTSIANAAAPYAYIANCDSDTVSVIDTGTDTVIATISVGDGPVGVATNPSGTKIYVTNVEGNSVSVIDTATNTVIATIPVGDGPTGISVNPAGTKIYVANSDSDSVSVIDAATNTVTATIPVGNCPVAFGQFIAQVVPSPLATPTLVSPAGDQLLTDYPRTTTYTWNPVAGATGYQIQIQYDMTGTGSYQDWTGSGAIVTGTSFVSDFGTDGPGRWRITALDDTGTYQPSAPSDWGTFRYDTSLITVPCLYLVPESAAAEQGQSKTYDLILDQVPDGLSGFDIYLNIDNPSVASITDVTLPGWAQVPRTTDMPPGTVRISGVDLDEELEAGATDTVLATFTVSGDSPGVTTITVTQASIDDDLGNQVTPVIVEGTLTVYVPLQAGFYALPLSVKQQETVSFHDQSTGTPGPATYLWNFGDGATSSEPNPSHTYQVPGKYTVTFTVTNQYSTNTEMKVDYIVVTGVIVFPDCTLLPTDPDGDGLYEDINGNGRLDFNDVVLLYKNMDWVRENEDVGIEPYDYNGNGELDFDDIIELYYEVLG